LRFSFRVFDFAASELKYQKYITAAVVMDLFAEGYIEQDMSTAAILKKGL
jgi:hypothetical protein